MPVASGPNTTDARRWEQLNRAIEGCARCPRLRAYCQEIARTRRRTFAQEDYWGHPVPNFGDPRGRLLVVGLAPAAHGANRTGRMFTGDRSGEWLFRALHRAGFASQAESRDRGDPLQLDDCAITAVCHCAPPDNRPTAEEQRQCQPWLAATLDLVPATVILALGQIAWNAVRAECRRRDWLAGPQTPFGHARQIALPNGRWFVGSYHPSQQNTFTGRLTEQMLDDIFLQICTLLAGRVNSERSVHT